MHDDWRHGNAISPENAIAAPCQDRTNSGIRAFGTLFTLAPAVILGADLTKRAC